MKAILMSIKPKYVAAILNGSKTIEIRKSIPKCDLPIDVYIYCCKQRKNEIGCHINYEKVDGKVVAKFTLKTLWKYENKNLVAYKGANRMERYAYEDLQIFGRVSQEELDKYVKDKPFYIWHIDNLVPFDEPKELREFSSKIEKTCICFNQFVAEGTRKVPLTRAPQSWCYCNQIQED